MKYLIIINLLLAAATGFSQIIEKQSNPKFHYELGTTLHFEPIFANKRFPIGFDFRATKTGKYYWGIGLSYEVGQSYESQDKELFGDPFFSFQAKSHKNYKSYISIERRFNFTEKFNFYTGFKYLFEIHNDNKKFISNVFINNGLISFFYDSQERNTKIGVATFLGIQYKVSNRFYFATQIELHGYSNVRKFSRRDINLNNQESDNLKSTISNTEFDIKFPFSLRIMYRF